MKRKTPLVFFNASVILAGSASPSGGSAKLLKWSRQRKIKGVISEIVLDEAIRHAAKIKLTKSEVRRRILATFAFISPAPKQATVERCQSLVIDAGDAHILASCRELKADFLVTLDKKHLLILQPEIKTFRIVSPKQLIQTIS